MEGSASPPPSLLDELLLLNVTEDDVRREADCMYRSAAEEVTTTADDEGQPMCPTVWDTILCWPRTPADTVALLPCFEEFKGIKYDSSQNATRLCHSNGTWHRYSDYSACMSPDIGPNNLDIGADVTSTLYLVGYSMSLVALSIAIWIFLYFKDLRCLRNTIHTNLMVTYVLADLLWILNLTLQTSMNSDAASCVVLTIMLHYFLLTTYFWMFVEGLYLYMLVVETFSGDNIKLRVYIFLGWGAPLIIVMLWSLVKSLAPISPGSEVLHAEYLHQCLSSPWMTPHSYDWIFKAPIIFVLAVNSVFLVMIMWVLITKLRSANTAETQQYRKATKALLVLIPLLGVAYILMIMGPTEGVTGYIFIYLRVVMLSTQGFTVALFYCFLNTEVQNTVRHHLDQWRTERSLRGSRRYNYSSRDWSPRSRTESIRLFHQPCNRYRKRESTVSETTTTTVVCGGGGGSFAGGGGGGGGPSNGSGCLNARSLLTAEKVV